MRLRLALILILVASLAQAQPSPDGTRIPPGNELVDAQGFHWKMYGGTVGDPRGLDNVDQMCIRNNVVYAHTAKGQWYKGVVNGNWTPIGTTDPCA